MKQIQPLIIIFLLVSISQTAGAQNNTSPYSVIGIGDIERSYFDRTSGMANTGVALFSSRYMYQANPASYSNMDNHFFNMEVATRFKAVTYSGTPVNSLTEAQSSDLQFKKVAIALKLKSRWAVSMGLMPFSTSNYSFGANKAIQGTTLTSPAYYEGSGNTTEFYIANSFLISKNLSVGVQASYLFGQMLQKETIFNSGGINDSDLVTSRNLSLGNFYFKFGLQYHTVMSEKMTLFFGATASPQTKLRADYSLQVQEGNTFLITNQYYNSNFFTLPAMYSGGIAALLNNKYTLALDYSYQGWTDLHYQGLSYTLVNSNKISAGFEYANKVKLRDGGFFEKSFLQAGLYYDESYLKINGKQLTSYGITLGAGATPLRGSANFGVQGGLDIGVRGTTNYGLIRENYTQFNLTLIYRDLWIPNKLKKFD